MSSSPTISGISGLSGFISSASPNNEMALSISSLLYASPYLSSVSMNGSPLLHGSMNCLRQMPKLSNAPECSSDSNPFLFTTPDILSTKSKITSKGPFSSRSARIAFTIFSPNPLIPPRPKRISPFLFTVNLASDSFTSGLSTLRPFFLQSSMIFLISSMLERFLVRLAAWNSAG